MHRILINRIPFVARESKKQGYLSVIFRLNHFQLFDVEDKIKVSDLEDVLLHNWSIILKNYLKKNGRN